MNNLKLKIDLTYVGGGFFIRIFPSNRFLSMYYLTEIVTRTWTENRNCFYRRMLKRFGEGI